MLSMQYHKVMIHQLYFAQKKIYTHLFHDAPIKIGNASEILKLLIA